MIELPIARREMLLLARSPIIYRARLTTGIVTLVVGIGFGILYSRAGMRGAMPFIGVVAYSLSLMCLFAGAQLTADAVAKEKREGTLGLLFLTGLSAWEITLGKFIANGLAAFFGIMVTFPLIALLLIIGGTQPGEVMFIALAVLNTLFVTAAAGLLVSTYSHEQKRAMGRATMVVLFFWWGLPLLAMLNNRFAGPRWLSDTLLIFSLNSTFFPSSIPFPGAPGLAVSPWVNLLATHVLGWLLLVLAAWLIHRLWKDRPVQNRFSFRDWWKRLSHGNELVRFRLRVQLLDRNPFLWLAARDRLRFIWVWVASVVMFGLAVFAYVASGYEPGPVIGLSIALSFIHRFIVAGASGTQLMIEQEQGTIEMLLSTPLSAKDVIYGQFRAALRQIRGPVLIVCLMHAFAIVTFYYERRPPPPFASVALIISLAFYFFDLYTGIWLAMWGAVTSRNPKNAAGAAIARLMGIPFFTVAAATILITMLNTMTGIRFSPDWQWTVAGIAALIIGNNIYWLRLTRRELPLRLHSYAFRRYSPQEDTGFFGTFGRDLGKLYSRALGQNRH